MEIQFRWDHDAPDPRAWTATLTVSHPDRVRIHQTRLQGAPAVEADGPINLHQGPFPALADHDTGRLSLWIEAREFPAAAAEANWRVRLTFDFTGSDGTGNDQTAELRIAPWLMASDLDPVSHVLFVENAHPVPPTEMQEEIRHFLPVGVEPLTRPPPDIQHAFYRPFLRDVMRCGWIMAPHHQDIAILERLEAQSSFVRLANNPILQDLVHPGRINHEMAGIPGPVAWGESSQDNGGNLLVTPPTAGYPFGRIVYGENYPDFICHPGPFFAAQNMQAPLVVDSSWLRVGHADEFISFVPDTKGGGPWPYKILLASARLGHILARAAWAHTLRPLAPPMPIEDLIAQADEINAAARAAEGANANWQTLQEQIYFLLEELAYAPPAPPPIPLGPQANPPPPLHHNGKIVTWRQPGQPHYEVVNIDQYLNYAAPPPGTL